MPRRATPSSFEDRLIEEFVSDLDQIADRLAAESGPPPESKRLSETEKVRRWGIVDRQVDYEALATALTTQGVPAEIAQALVIVQEHPDLIDVYTQPTQDADLADTLARLAEYPGRLGLLMDIDDPEEQVAEANRLERAWQQSLGSAFPSSEEGENPEPMPMMSQPPAAPMAAPPMPEQPPAMPATTAPQQPPMEGAY